MSTIRALHEPYDRYLGDGYPLCSSLPRNAFLRRGATFILLGTTTSEVFVPLDETASELYQAYMGTR